ncbi:MAG: MFS transporter [Pseudomonas sp. PGPPP4]|uniref:MFS transporter n=1 Tax=Pseudomonas sp. PGPPP4 TaxID=2015556 RepID=UPI000BCF474E|nr:MFS transporter [Pseudomonas sp. PGPPP4]OYT78954.1 MAG: MFS transporter [Pseudomonas sp. PGPPP4]
MAAEVRGLRLLLVIQLLSMGAMEMSGPFWPLQIASLLGPEGAQYTALLSAAVYTGPLLAAMLLTPFWGRLGDRTGHRPMILRALLALALCQGLAAMVSDAWALVAVRVVQGGLAGFLAAAQAYALVWCAGGSRGSTLAQLQSVTALGSLLGPVLGGWLLDAAGFRLLCTSALAICLLCALAALWLPADRPQPRTHRGAQTQALPRGWLAGILLVIVLVQAAKLMPQPFYALYVAQVLQAPGWLIGASYGASALSLALSAPLWARLFDRWQPARTLALIEGVAWACALTLAATALAGSWPSFLATRLLWGLWQGALLPVAYALIANTLSASQQGFALGLGNSAAKAGALLGTLLGGAAMAVAGLDQAFWLVAALYFTAALGIRLIRQSGLTPAAQAPNPSPTTPQ